MENYNSTTPDRRSFLKNGSLFLFGFVMPSIIPKKQYAKSQLDNQAIEEEPIEEEPVITIRQGKEVATLITVFKVLPENEEKLINLIISGTNDFFSKQPGFISESVHNGATSGEIVLYGQWENISYIEAFRKKPEIGPYFQQILALAQPKSIVCTSVPFIQHK